MSAEIHYPEEFIERLQIVWGEGFLSPGGPEEVHAIVSGLDLGGKRVLDIGCGTGGPAVLLARDYRADVVGIDIEPQLLERAKSLASKAGVSVDWRLVEPGPLAFPANSFDFVFSKDALIHVPDKPALFAEILRVLKPGGVFAASDWLIGEGGEQMPGMKRYLSLTHLHFALATAAETEGAMQRAGFVDVATRDRNAWYAAWSRRDVGAMEGPLRRELTALLGEEGYEQGLEVRRANAEAAREGSLRPTHLRSLKPLA
jgi:SAM-dependent methyltransferase